MQCVSCINIMKRFKMVLSFKKVHKQTIYIALTKAECKTQLL